MAIEYPALLEDTLYEVVTKSSERFEVYQVVAEENPVTSPEIVEASSASRSLVNRAVNKYEEEGWIETPGDTQPHDHRFTPYGESVWDWLQQFDDTYNAIRIDEKIQKFAETDETVVEENEESLREMLKGSEENDWQEETGIHYEDELEEIADHLTRQGDSYIVPVFGLIVEENPTSQKIEEETGLPNSTANRYANDMIDANLVKKTDEGTYVPTNFGENIYGWLEEFNEPGKEKLLMDYRQHVGKIADTFSTETARAEMQNALDNT